MDEIRYLRLLEYVDTRGVWPVYHCGMIAVQLPGKRHDVSTGEARDLAVIILNG